MSLSKNILLSITKMEKIACEWIFLIKVKIIDFVENLMMYSTYIKLLTRVKSTNLKSKLFAIQWKSY